MKSSKKRGIFKSFNELKGLLKERSLPSHNKDFHDTKRTSNSVTDLTHKNIAEDEETLFLNAMADVVPISNEKIVKAHPKANTNPVLPVDEEKEIEQRLSNLVIHGEGFEVSSTPEYIEGTNYNVHPEISKRLHKGVFSIQEHVDLHGMTIAEAKIEFDDLFQRATRSGLRGLLIIHGRGLSSPGKPVLKEKVHEWLSYGFWRKWVIAFSSARSCDGGTGATYVLLRKSPFTKRHRKRFTKRTYKG